MRILVENGSTLAIFDNHGYNALYYAVDIVTVDFVHALLWREPIMNSQRIKRDIHLFFLRRIRGILR